MQRPSLKAIFISHVSGEAALADLLKHALDRDFKRRATVFVSSDISSIECGADWMDAIERAIKESCVLIVLCSHSSIRTPWVNFELGAAWIRRIPIVPICHSGLTPADLPMPLIAKEGIVADSPGGLAKLYKVLSRHLDVVPAKPRLSVLAKQAAEIERGEAKLAKESIVQFEYHVDLILPAPGRLTEERIPAETPIQSNAKSLQLFGLLDRKPWTWADLESAAKRNRDTRWLTQLQRCVYLASNDQTFSPMQAIFHTTIGSYQPDLARMELMPNGSRILHIHFVNTVVPPLADVPNDFGKLATVLRLGLRFRYEVIEKFEDQLRRASSWNEGPRERPGLLVQIRMAIETIDCDAESRGAEDLSEDSIARLFEPPSEQQRVRDISRRWKEIRPQWFDPNSPLTVQEARHLFNDLRDMNYDFMVLGTRQLQRLVEAEWFRKSLGENEMVVSAGSPDLIRTDVPSTSSKPAPCRHEAPADKSRARYR